MPLYECVFIARQDVSSAQVDSLAQDFANLVAENGGQVTKTENWGLRTLAYRIKKNRKGHYVLMNLDAPPAAIQEMERNMRISDDVIRYLTIHVDELEEGPSVILQSRGRGDRDHRGDRGDRRGPRDGGGRRFEGGSRDERNDSRAPSEKTQKSAQKSEGASV